MTDGAELEAFLARHPWPTELLEKGRPLQFLWLVDVKAPLERVWPLLIDTSRFNRVLGVTEMQFEERDGRLHGSTVNGGFRQEWVEAPWQWVAGRTILAMRHYSRGFSHVVRFSYEAVEVRDDGMKLAVYFGWIPRNLLGRTALTIGASWMERRYREVLPQLAESSVRASEASGSDALPPEFERKRAGLSAEGESRLQHGKRTLLNDGMPAPLVDKLCEHLRSADDMDLDRIQLKRLARRWDASERELLRVALHATRAGLLALSWDVICPHCRGVRQERSKLQELPGAARCDVCAIDFDTRPETAIEVTFRVHPSVRYVVKREYCAAEPAHQNHIKVQQSLSAGEQRAVEPKLLPGLYRLRVGSSKSHRLLEVREDETTATVLWRASDDGDAGALRVSPSPRLEMVNDAERDLPFILEEARWSDEALRPAELFSLVDFRDLFSEDYIEADVQLSVGLQTILFTDMVGSTRFYATRGDPEAFAQVKRHFSEVFGIVASHDGVVVKTIGDAVMAAFADPTQAVRAANAIHERFTAEREDLDIRLRISLHRGPCIAVQLNSDIDYFGGTVNLSAKLQACVDAGQTAISDAVWQAPGVRELLESAGATPEPLSLKVAALDGEVAVHRWSWPLNAAGSDKPAGAEADGALVD